MFFIIKTTFKLLYFSLAVLGAYYLFSTNFQPTDFLADTKKAVEEKFGTVDTEEIKKQATEKINAIVRDNRDVAKEVVEEKIKEAVDEAVEQVKGNIASTTALSQIQNEDNSLGKIAGCRQGYYFSEIFVAGCVQADCDAIDGAQLNDQGRCECSPEKQVKFREIDFKECPGCLYACE